MIVFSECVIVKESPSLGFGRDQRQAEEWKAS
jgi:hypothetical protein